MTQTVEATAEAPAAETPVPAELRVTTGQASEITGLHARTLERYVDKRFLRGGRLLDPATGEPIPLTWRWVHAGDAVQMAIDRGRGHLIPAQWRHLIPQQPTAEHHSQ
jgi:hypothetical protein